MKYNHLLSKANVFGVHIHEILSIDSLVFLGTLNALSSHFQNHTLLTQMNTLLCNKLFIYVYECNVFNFRKIHTNVHSNITPKKYGI